jgi:hypothetical protein
MLFFLNPDMLEKNIITSIKNCFAVFSESKNKKYRRLSQDTFLWHVFEIGSRASERPDEFVKKTPKMWPNPFFANIM